MPSKADSDLVRSQNRHLVLEALRFAGHAPRIALGASTGLSLATITSITTQLLSENLLVEAHKAGHARPQRGRPKVDLRLNPKSALVLAVKISIDTFELALADYSGARLVYRLMKVPTFTLSSEQAVHQLAAFVNESLAPHAVQPKEVRRAAIAVQGAADAETGHLIWSPAFSVQNIALSEPLRLLTGIEFKLANDANMIAEGMMAREHYAYKGTAAIIFMGYGVGMGLVINGKTYHGTTGAAAEFGHMNHIPRGALCRCGRAGCIEAYAADYGILRQAEGSANTVAPAPCAVEPEVMQALEDAARAGDARALNAFHQAGEAIGFGLARMIALLNPDRIVISGPGIRAFDLVEPSLRNAIDEAVVPALRQHITIETLPMNQDMIMAGTLDKLLHDLDREVFAKAIS